MNLTGMEMARAVRSREVSSVELVRSVLDSIEAVDPEIHAYLTVDREGALRAAEAADTDVRQRVEVGPLHGVPVSVKDLIEARGIRVTHGSLFDQDERCARDHPSVAKWRAAGAIVVGKTNTPEHGLLGETRNLLGEDTRNPWDLSRTALGSSGGAAAAVSAGLGPLALGSDGAGSIVAPAAATGVLGIKPTHQQRPATTGHGHLYADHGPLAASLDDLACGLSLLLPQMGEITLAPNVQGVRVRVSTDLGLFPVDNVIADAVHAAARVLDGAGALIDRSLVTLPNPWDIYDPVFLRDTWIECGQAVERTPQSFHPDVVAEVMLGRAFDGEDAGRALAQWTDFTRATDRLFEGADVLLTPTIATLPFPVGEPPRVIGGVEVNGRWTTFMPFPVAWNISGNPELAVPLGLSTEGLPIGVTLIAPRGRDADLFPVAAALLEAYPLETSPLLRAVR